MLSNAAKRLENTTAASAISTSELVHAAVKANMQLSKEPNLTAFNALGPFVKEVRNALPAMPVASSAMQSWAEVVVGCRQCIISPALSSEWAIEVRYRINHELNHLAVLTRHWPHTEEQKESARRFCRAIIATFG